MSVVRFVFLASLAFAFSCGGGQKTTDGAATPANEKTPTATPAADTEAEETPTTQPTASDPDAELRAIEEASMGGEMTRSRSRSAGSSRSGGRDYAADQDRKCHDACDRLAGDLQDQGKPQFGANQVGKCHARCAKQASMRTDFLDCMESGRSAEECRSDFREAWTKQDND